jgi:hypothetical protein
MHSLLDGLGCLVNPLLRSYEFGNLGHHTLLTSGHAGEENDARRGLSGRTYVTRNNSCSS